MVCASCAYHARMARRAQHLWCYICERSERADNKLDNSCAGKEDLSGRALIDPLFLHRKRTPWSGLTVLQGTGTATWAHICVHAWWYDPGPFFNCVRPASHMWKKFVESSAKFIKAWKFWSHIVMFTSMWSDRVALRYGHGLISSCMIDIFFFLNFFSREITPTKFCQVVLLGVRYKLKVEAINCL